jgi:RHS repeat-associated protein
VAAVKSDGTEELSALYPGRNAFGALEGASAGGGTNTESGYTGASTPNQTGGFTYLRNRWYDPATGRFLTQDPIGLAGGVDLYAYAGNDPVTYSDPFGLCPDPGKPWCSSPLYHTMRLFGASDPTADKWAGVAYGGAMIAGAPGSGLAVRGGGEALASAAIAAEAPNAGPIPGTTYTPKVMDQIQQGDNHAFPKLVDQFAADGSATQITGGDGVVRTQVQVPGAINGKDGNYTWIIEPDGLINHRLFEKN